MVPYKHSTDCASSIWIYFIIIIFIACFYSFLRVLCNNRTFQTCNLPLTVFLQNNDEEFKEFKGEKLSWCPILVITSSLFNFIIGLYSILKVNKVWHNKHKYSPGDTTIEAQFIMPESDTKIVGRVMEYKMRIRRALSIKTEQSPDENIMEESSNRIQIEPSFGSDSYCQMSFYSDDTFATEQSDDDDDVYTY